VYAFRNVFILVGPIGLIPSIHVFDFDMQCLLQNFYTVNQSHNVIHDFVVFKIAWLKWNFIKPIIDNKFVFNSEFVLVLIKKTSLGVGVCGLNGTLDIYYYRIHMHCNRFNFQKLFRLVTIRLWVNVDTLFWTFGNEWWDFAGWSGVLWAMWWQW